MYPPLRATEVAHADLHNDARRALQFVSLYKSNIPFLFSESGSNIWNCWICPFDLIPRNYNKFENKTSKTVLSPAHPRARANPPTHTHSGFFPSQVVIVVCSAACCCQEAHAISQFSSVSPLDHHTNPTHSLNQTRVRLHPPPYLSNLVLQKHKPCLKNLFVM